MAIIDKPSDYFNTKLYTGNSSTQSITGVGFQPDWVWCKSRNGADNHAIFDSVRGGQKQLRSNTTGAELTRTNAISSFDSDGWSMGSQPEMNSSGATYASWSWKAGGTASSNTNGSITSSVSANQDAGFSIVSYTGTGANATVGHGLGVAPKMIITKYRDGANNWGVYHKDIGAGKYLELNTAIAEASNTAVWNNTDPTSSVFSVGTNNRANSAGAMVAYCFAEKQGYSKFGSYTGNGSTDGTFVYLGFKPAFLLYKNASGNFTNWQVHDSKRSTYNLSVNRLNPNDSSVELGTTADSFDFLSNGFKARATAINSNTSGSTYIYMAFAENPFVTSTGVCATAR